MKRFLAAALAAMAISSCGSAQTVTVAPTVVVSAPTIVPTDAPTNTPKPTSTPAPTSTPKPTITPEPTATPVPTRIPFQDVIVHGTGQRVVDNISLPIGWYSMTFLHSGKTGNTVVESYSPTGEKDLLVNVIGCCGGTYLLNSLGGAWQFEVKATGKWDIAIGEVKSDELDVDKVLIGGSGDDISKSFKSLTERVPYLFTHEGDANFAVWLTCDDGSRQLVQNEVGIVANEVIVEFPSGRCVWEARANGAWIAVDSNFYKTEMCKPENDIRAFLRDLCTSLK